jgi:hypothetical protein
MSKNVFTHLLIFLHGIKNLPHGQLSSWRRHLSTSASKALLPMMRTRVFDVQEEQKGRKKISAQADTNEVYTSLVSL